MCSRILDFGLARPDNCSSFRRFSGPPVVAWAWSDHDLKQQDLILPPYHIPGHSRVIWWHADHRIRGGIPPGLTCAISDDTATVILYGRYNGISEWPTLKNHPIRCTDLCDHICIPS
jgi:hypothetical protein